MSDIKPTDVIEVRYTTTVAEWNKHVAPTLLTYLSHTTNFSVAFVDKEESQSAVQE